MCSNNVELRAEENDVAGNKAGGQRCAATNKARYGANYYVKLGHLGGSAPTRYPKGFAANREAARRGGALGGRISRRGKKN